MEMGTCEWSLSPFGPRNKVVNRERIEKVVTIMKGGGSMIRKRAKEM